MDGIDLSFYDGTSMFGMEKMAEIKGKVSIAFLNPYHTVRTIVVKASPYKVIRFVNEHHKQGESIVVFPQTMYENTFKMIQAEMAGRNSEASA